MVAIRDHVRFLLNDEQVELHDVRPGDTLLDYLRLNKHLRGTKEGCAEGDCGACTVLVGRLSVNGLVYESVNTCIRFVGSLDGCHVVTVEHLANQDGGLHPVQQALVDEHGSQCGFCTPGFVMSLYGLWMRKPNPTTAEIEQALQGNLCRCTGYEPIVKAAQAISNYGKSEQDPLNVERSRVAKQLAGLQDGARVEVSQGEDRIIVPANADDLAEVFAKNPDATIVAGSTDVGLWVTKFMRDISPVMFIGHLTDLQQISVNDDYLTIGAGVTYTELNSVIGEHFPQLREFWSRIGGDQVRNMGTVGGNIANGSPIGDTPPVLIALEAKIILRHGDNRRELLLEDFFVDYGKQDRNGGEFVESIRIPKLPDGDLFAAHKISKRRDEDISSVCGAFRLKLNNGLIEEAIFAFGGMAATPKRASGAESSLIGQPWNEASLAGAREALKADFTPITDMRASAEYRALVAGNLLHRFFLETTGHDVRISREQVA